MSTDNPCPRCGARRPPDAPEGLCPECLLRLAWNSDLSAGSGEARTNGGAPGHAGPRTTQAGQANTRGALETLAETAGPIPRVLLRDTDLITGTGPVVRPASSEMPDPVDRAGRLQLLGEIARGGMGAILKGRDNDLGRDLAVKVLLERHGDNPELLRRFVEEAQIAGQLQHPGVVPVYELGTFADRRPYFAMKLVKGRTLAEVLAERGGPSSDHPRLLAIFLDVAQTMAYSHARGVIHRDLKPSNVMVGSFGEVQVMDWGLAKVLPRGGAIDDRDAGKLEVFETVISTARSGSDSGTDLSQAGSVLGTPSYMAPEQARGENEHLDERADVFALGSILCEILTGQPAFTGRSSGEILRLAARGDLSGAWKRLDACVTDAELVALTRDALAPEADDRPHDAGTIVDRLSGYLSGVQEKLRVAERERAVADARAVEERRRRKLQVGLAASILGILMLGAGGAFWYVQQRQALLGRVAVVLREAEVLRDQALGDPTADPARWQAAQSAARRADDLLGETQDPTARARLADLNRQIEEGVQVARKDRRMVERLEQIHGDYMVHHDRKLKDAHYTTAFRDYGIDVEVLGPAEAARRIAARRIARELAGAIDHWTYNRRGAIPPDMAGAATLTAIVKVADPDPWRNRLRDLLNQSSVNRAGVLDKLRALADTADLKRLPMASIQRLAAALRSMGDPERSLAVLTAVYPNHPDDPQIVYDLSEAYMVGPTPRYADAVGYALAGVSLSPRSALFRTQLTRCLNAMNRMDAALLNAREAVRLDPDAAAGHVELGIALLKVGERGEAELEFRTVKRSPENSGLINNIGNAYSRLDRLPEAEDYYREAIRLDPGNETAHSNLGYRALDRGKLDDALNHFRKAREAGQDNPTFLPTIERGLAQAERMIALRGRLPALFRGEDRPADQAERLAFAEVSYHGQFHAASTRLYDEALRSNPSLAQALDSHRYNAACVAALAGCGQGKDEPAPDAEARAKLRRRALDWLKAEQVGWKRALETANADQRKIVAQKQRHWKEDPDLAGIRDPAELAKLPEAERKDWLALWAEVDVLLARAKAPK